MSRFRGASSRTPTWVFERGAERRVAFPADGALKALTQWPAEILGVDKEIGTIATGKLANLFITTGDPLDLRTQVVEVFIKGRQVPDDDRHNRLYIKYKARPKPVIIG